MLIRSKILRAGGTKVSLTGGAYDFQPHKGDPSVHVAEVSNKAHVAQFLSVPEGFEIFSAKDSEDAAEQAAKIIATEKGEDQAETDALASMTDGDLAEAFKELFDRLPNRAARRVDVENKIRTERIRRETEAAKPATKKADAKTEDPKKAEAAKPATKKAD